MSMTVSTPRMSATPSTGRPKVDKVSGQDYQRGSRYACDAFAREHQRQQHRDLRTEGQWMIRSLRDEHRCQRQIER